VLVWENRFALAPVIGMLVMLSWPFPEFVRVSLEAMGRPTISLPKASVAR
jgi:hypothetical protein